MKKEEGKKHIPTSHRSIKSMPGCQILKCENKNKYKTQYLGKNIYDLRVQSDFPKSTKAQIIKVDRFDCIKLLHAIASKRKCLGKKLTNSTRLAHWNPQNILKEI